MRRLQKLAARRAVEPVFIRGGAKRQRARRLLAKNDHVGKVGAAVRGELAKDEHGVDCAHNGARAGAKRGRWRSSSKLC